MNAPAPKAPEFGAETYLPKLRRELLVSKAGVDATEAGGAIAQDPLRHKFFRCGNGTSLSRPAF